MTDAEAAFLATAMARLIPSDDLSPSATDLGCVRYLDRQRAARRGEGRDWYLEGPISPGTEQQGYQLGLSPRELCRTAIVALQDGLTRATGSPPISTPTASRGISLPRRKAGALAAHGLPRRPGSWRRRS